MDITTYEGAEDGYQHFRDVEKLVRRYINEDPQGRFEFEGWGGGGANGSVYKLRGRADGTRVALKIVLAAFFEDDPENEVDEYLKQIQNESDWLDKLQHCPHIIHKVDIGTQDPLDRLETEAPTSRYPGARKWIYMEWEDNATLTQFIERWDDVYGDTPIPNRILWGFFMCIVRQALEIGFYNDPTVDVSQSSLEQYAGKTAGGFLQGDMTPNNMVLGDLLPRDQTGEHVVTPIVKLIDFGEAEEIDLLEYKQDSPNDYLRVAELRHIRDIGSAMIDLLLLKKGALASERVVVEDEGLQFTSFCKRLIDRNEELVEAGMDPQYRPSLHDLATMVHRKLDDGSQDDQPDEDEDNYIRDLVKSVLTAPLPEREW